MEMKKQIYDLKVMGKAKNYNKWIYDNIKNYTGKRILEAGCGIGNMTKYFLNCELIISVDCIDECVQAMKSRYNQENLLIMKIDLNDKSIMDIKKYSIDTVVCINIIEHIEDDIRVLERFHELLEEHGRLILMVPAFQAMYGTIDKGDLHYRRYGRKELDKKLQDSKFNVLKSYYFNMFGIFPWVIRGKILKKTVQPPIGLIDRFVPISAFIEKLAVPPFGLSLIYICEKG